jgi:hypothetical protein
MGHSPSKGEMRYAYKSLVTKPEWKRPFGRSRNRLHDTIMMDLGEIAYEGVDWNHLDWDRKWWQALIHTVMNQWDFLTI